MAKKSFYIIDGHAQIYRAYFAPFRELTGPNGEPTKATFVFTQWLINLIQQRKPDYLAMVIDSGGDEGVFRRDISGVQGQPSAQAGRFSGAGAAHFADGARRRDPDPGKAGV